MLVGVPKEIKDHEYRVGLVPSTVHELTAKGHQVLLRPTLASARACPIATTSPPAPRSRLGPIRSSRAPR
jgi:Alanine dehydrogenase/PNT, N-terminal domain